MSLRYIFCELSNWLTQPLVTIVFDRISLLIANQSIYISHNIEQEHLEIALLYLHSFKLARSEAPSPTVALSFLSTKMMMNRVASRWTSIRLSFLLGLTLLVGRAQAQCT
jgi:hypothetical protein